MGYLKGGAVMGSVTALGIQDSVLDLETQLAYHLQGNHYPPVPLSMVQPCIDAIEEIADKFKNNDFIVLDGIENYPYFTPYFFVQLDRICKLRLNSGKPIMMFSNGTHDQIKAGSGWASLLKSCLLIKLPQILS